MATIPQQITFDNYAYGQQAVIADSSNMQKTQFYQVNNGQATTLQTYNGNNTVVNTTTYLQTPTYSPQALNETTTPTNLMLTNATVTSPTTTTVNSNPQPISIPNTVPSQQQSQYVQQTISPVEGNGMNFFSSLPLDNSIKNGQIINQSNDQRYPSPPLGAIDINKNQCQQVAVATPIIVTNATTNGFVSQSIPLNQGTITQAQPTQTMAIINTNGMNVANTTNYQQQAAGYQQYYNQSFTQIQGKAQQQTIISSTTNISSNYPQANLNGKIGLTVNQNVVNTPLTIKTNSRSKSKEPISLELALKRQKNTEAARRSRMRKVLKMETLENHVKRLEAENKNLSIRLAMLESNRIEWETKEKTLLEKIKTLEEQLEEARNGQNIGIMDETMVKEELDIKEE